MHAGNDSERLLEANAASWNTGNDLEKLNLVHDDGSKITKEEIKYVIDHLKKLRDLRRIGSTKGGF